MKSGKITISNYRNIAYNNPITLEIKEGISFILGVNNVGKSNLLKFFYELKSILGVFSVTKSGTTSTINIVEKSQSQILNEGSVVQNKYSLDILIETKDQWTLDLSLHGQKGSEEKNTFSYNMKSNSYSGGHEPTHLYNAYGLIYALFEKSMYIGSFRNANLNTSGDYFDIKVGTQFINQWHTWQTGTEKSKNKKIDNLVEELKHLFGFEKLQIMATEHKDNLKVTNEDGTFTLDELGGGISHFIIVLGNALIQEPNFILIDEPENALHPKLQQTFVQALASKAKYGLIATSHSLGLAKSVADNIYHLTKDQKTKKLSLKNFGEVYKPSILNSIHELGYSQFVELGGHNILLVEGRTDIKSFKEILKKYNIEHHFIMIDLGGAGNINGESFAELQELKRLNANGYFVIFDSEITQEGQVLKKKFQDFVDNCESLGFKVFPTDVHSTENYITQDALDKCNVEGYTALSKYEDFSKRNSDKKWSKGQNWRMFKEMSLEDFKDTKLHDFIENEMKKAIKPT